VMLGQVVRAWLFDCRLIRKENCGLTQLGASSPPGKSCSRERGPQEILIVQLDLFGRPKIAKTAGVETERGSLLFSDVRNESD